MSDRNSIMVSMFKDGKTLQEIGDIYDITRERVRQILFNYGISGKDGGNAVRARKKKEDERKRRDKVTQEKYGCSLDFYESMRGDEPYHDSRIYKFRTQKENAKKRDIDWNLNFEEWCNIWGDKWEERGRTLGQYVMARHGDTGPYAIDNVKIVTCSENIMEYYSSLDDPFEHGEKVREGQKEWRKSRDSRD